MARQIKPKTFMKIVYVYTINTTHFPDSRVRYHDGDFTRYKHQSKSIEIEIPTRACGSKKRIWFRVDSNRGPSDI